MEKSCFFASTKFQLINAIVIAVQEKLEADLYLIDEGIYKNAKELGEAIRNERIFRNVYVVDTDSINANAKTTHFQSVFLYLNNRKFINKILHSFDYSKAFFSTNSLVERMAKYFFLKHRKADIYYFDEGIASYIGAMEKKNKFERIIRRIAFGSRSLISKFDRYLYTPELYYNSSSEEKIYKINGINEDPYTLYALNRIFDYNDNMNLGRKALVIDTAYKSAFKEGKCIDYLNTIEKVIECFNNDIVIKPHPSEKNNYFQNVDYITSDIPFELMLSNSNIDDKVIISLASTAAVTPKLIFNKEPTVILLYNLFYDSLNVWNEFYDDYFKKIQKLYNSNRFYIPSSFNELNDVLHRIEGGGI